MTLCKGLSCYHKVIHSALRAREGEGRSLIIISSLREEFSLFLWEVQLCEDYRRRCWIYSQVSLVIIQGGMSEKIIWSLTLIFAFVEEQLLENSLLVSFPSSIQNSFEQEVIQHRVSTFLCTAGIKFCCQESIWIGKYFSPAVFQHVFKIDRGGWKADLGKRTIPQSLINITWLMDQNQNLKSNFFSFNTMKLRVSLFIMLFDFKMRMLYPICVC